MVKYMFFTLKEYLIGAFLAALVYFGIALSPASCSRTVGPENGKLVDSVLVIRHDTIRTIDSVLKKRVVYVDTGRIEYIHDTLDSIIKPIGNENICIAENQLRQCVKCQDSLSAFKQKASIDSQTIDTLSNIAKKIPDTIKACTLGEQAKSFGLGTLFGIAIRSLF